MVKSIPKGAWPALLAPDPRQSGHFDNQPLNRMISSSDDWIKAEHKATSVQSEL